MGDCLSGYTVCRHEGVIMKYSTGKDYPWLCSSCQLVIDTIAGTIDQFDDKYASDEEGPRNFAYDHGLFCEGHTCVGRD